MGKLYGVGVNDSGIPIKKDGKKLKEYDLWGCMLKRCYSDKYHQVQPTYKECEVNPFSYPSQTSIIS